MPKKFLTIFIVLSVLIAAFFLLNYQKKVSIFSNEKIKTISDEPVTFLVLGKTGKVIGWNRAPELADAILVVDYRPKLEVLNLVSLPRDLWLDFGNKSMKLNEITRQNKIPDLLNRLPDMIGLQTDKYIVVDIDILKGVVDALGGIDLNLEEKAVDWVSGYTIEAGQRHLDGNQVIWLVRNRFAPEGDFFREKNQHEVIQAMIDKYKKINAFEKATFVFKMAPEFTKLQTNMDFQKFLPFLEKIGNIRFNDVVLDFETGLLQSSSTLIGNGTSTAYILVPKLGRENYSEIKNFIESKLEK
ncbi:MAG: LCP family protein [Patescibacteria group bacterium]